MGHIVAIGGGELRYLETLPIDRYIVNLTNKPQPKALFIPTASRDASGYVESFNKVYADLGCITEPLLLVESTITEEVIKDKIMSADIIYVGGGNTLFMLNIWKEKKVDQYLRQAYQNNTILCGLSAGSICWFKYGHSDSLINVNEQGYVVIEALGLIDGIHCPHYNEEERQQDFPEKMKNTTEIGFAIEDNCALEIAANQYRLIKSNDNAKAYRFYLKDGIVVKEEIISSISYRPLHELYRK